MKTRLFLSLFITLITLSIQAHTLEPLHVDGRYLKNSKGDIVTLHGYMTSLDSWFQAEDFKFDNYDFEGALINKKAATDSVLATGWKMDYVRFLFSDYYFDKGDGYKGFDLGLFKKYLDEFCLPLIDYYHEKGIYTILLPPTSSPILIEDGDEFQNFLLILWDCISSHPRIMNNPGVMFELANEPVNFNCKYSIYDGLPSYELNNRVPFKEVRDYWQPIVDKIRSHCNNIIYVPGMQWQSDFTGFADYPVVGGNIGYAIHWYPSWWGNMRKDWEEHVFPVAYMAPFVITETGWGIYEAIEGTTTNFGNPLKEIIDDLGNVSWNCWVAYEDYYYLVNDETSENERATIANDPEVYYKPLYLWWNDYAHTKVIPTNQLKARAVSFDNFPTTVSPGKYWLARIKAKFSNGLSWDVSGDAEYTVSDENVLTIKNGVINARKEGTATVGVTYTDGTGQTFSRQFSITSTLFPLTNQGFDPNLTIATSSFDESTGTFSSEGWDFGGWTFGEGLDLSSYQYLVFQLHEPPQYGALVHIWDVSQMWNDENGGWNSACDPISGQTGFDFGSTTELVMDLHNLKNKNGQPLNLSHIYRVAIENHSGSVKIKKVFLSNDGITPSPYTGELVVVFADNKTIFYGDDIPDLTYSVFGNGNIGEPKVTTTATKTSPVGTYDILISGNVDGVTYNPGKLTIVPAPLTVMTNDVVVGKGKDIPAFTLSYDGLRNGETSASAFSEQPIATTAATKESPCGKYDITVSSGKAANYDVTYSDAMLTIIPDQNITLPVDRTAIAATSTEAWEAWGESWAVPGVTTADGRTAPMAERYEETVATTGKMMEQIVTGLEPGEYTVVFYANAYYTDGRGFDSDIKEGAKDVVELYANDARLPMTAHIGTATNQNETYTFTDVKVIDGTMRIGMEKLKAGTNWHTLQIKSLTLTKIYSLSESFAQALAKAEEFLPQRMSGVTRNTLQQAMVVEQTYPNYYLLADALQQARISIEAQARAARALKVMKNELLTATNVCTSKAASAYKQACQRLEKAYDEDRVSNKTALNIYNPYEGGGEFYYEFLRFMMSAWEYNTDNTNWMEAPYSVSSAEPFGKDLVPYIDYWSADGYWSIEGKHALDARTLTAIMTDMEPGQYAVTALVRLYRMNDSNEAPKGITLQVCNGEPVTIGGKQKGDTNYYIDYYKANGTVGSDGVLTIKFHVADDNNVSHLAFRDLYQISIKSIGDVNGDSKVDIGDVNWIVSHIIGQTPVGFNRCAADVTGDGVINAADIVAILNIIKKTS